jgi:hypothetical protein
LPDLKTLPRSKNSFRKNIRRPRTYFLVARFRLLFSSLDLPAVTVMHFMQRLWRELIKSQQLLWCARLVLIVVRSEVLGARHPADETRVPI